MTDTLFRGDERALYERLIVAEKLHKEVTVDPYYGDRMSDWVRSQIRMEVSRFGSEESYDLWRAGVASEAALPDSVSFSGKVLLGEAGGLLVNKGGNYICRKLREITAVTDANGNPDTSVHFTNALAKINVSTATTPPAVTNTDLAATLSRLAMTTDGAAGYPNFPKIQGETYMDLNYVSGLANATVGQRAIVFAGVAGSTIAPGDWRTFGITNGVPGTAEAILLDHFQPAVTQGTKAASGQVWVCWITITFS